MVLEEPEVIRSQIAQDQKALVTGLLKEKSYSLESTIYSGMSIGVLKRMEKRLDYLHIIESLLNPL